MNVAKTAVLGELQGEDEADLEEFMAKWDGPLCLRSDAEASVGANGARLGHILREAGATTLPKTKRVNLDGRGGKKTGVILLHPSADWTVERVMNMTGPEIVDHCERARERFRAADAAGDFLD